MATIPIPQGATIGSPDNQGAVPIPEGASIGAPEGAEATHGASVSATPPLMSRAGLKSAIYSAIDATLNSLPAAGATIGGVLGGAAGTGAEPGGGTVMGAVGGAGVGGMAGETVRQAGRKALGWENPASAGDLALDVAKEGAIQGGIEAATAGVGRAAGPLARGAEKQYFRALSPTTVENKVIAQDIAPQMVKRGITGGTESIEKQATENVSALRPKLDAAYATPAAQSANTAGSVAKENGFFDQAKAELGPNANASDILQRAQQLKNAAPVAGTAKMSAPITKTLSALDEMKSKYVVDGKMVNPQAYDAIGGVQKIIQQHGDNISQQSLRRIKQIFDESVSEAGGYTNADLTTNYTLKAQRKAANSIRQILHEANPDAAALDKEMSFWLDVQQVTRATNIRRVGQSGGLVQSLAPSTGAVIGAVTGGTFGHSAEMAAGGAVAGALAAATKHILTSPGWRTASAVVKDRLAMTLARGDVQGVFAIAARFSRSASQSNPTPTDTQ